MMSIEAGQAKIRKRRSSFGLLLALLLIFSPGFGKSVQPAKNYSRVRVLLTVFEKRSEIDIGIFGNYQLDQTISFQYGSDIRLSIAQGRILLRYEGLGYLGGQSIQLIRYKGENGQENGLRIHGQNNLYPGDLRVSIKDGFLSLIMTLPVEEYLQGVVPYEMDDGFPLEALKAQAIAARTYTLAHLDASKAYDVVDNTNDQVFRGINPQHQNAINAIEQTKGVVSVFEGALARPYYTASNGGITESAYNAWGREIIPYLIIQKDPYDIENPLSISKTAAIAKEKQAGMNQQSILLYDIITNRLRAQLINKGSLQEGHSLEILGIDQVQPHSTKYGGKDGVMKFLRFDVSALVERPSSLAQDEEVSVTGQSAIGSNKTNANATEKRTQNASVDILIFPDIEQLLGLSINRNENEIVTVKTDDHKHLIAFGRYGHGVGMSQRGAEWMAAHYNWKYEQILRFYYPGTSLETYDTQAEPLGLYAFDYLATPGPAPTATPRPTLMPLNMTPAPDQKIILVDGIAENSSLNLRLQPDYLSGIVTRLYYGQRLILVEELENGWMEVKTDTLTGFLRHEFVSIQP